MIVSRRGTECPRREFLYAKDAARGILEATERYDRSYPVNPVAPGRDQHSSTRRGGAPDRPATRPATSERWATTSRWPTRPARRRRSNSDLADDFEDGLADHRLYEQLGRTILQAVHAPIRDDPDGLRGPGHISDDDWETGRSVSMRWSTLSTRPAKERPLEGRTSPPGGSGRLERQSGHGTKRHVKPSTAWSD